MRQGDKNPHKNKTNNKICTLNSRDQGVLRQIIVEDDGYTLAFSSDPCKDGWDWQASSIDDLQIEDESWTNTP